ncbi:MAG: bifunctional oligoribonuclease/PAP phosphatase NrnA [Bacteroidales bacterium]|nr:bifunctional oligoribonuclease/PAP phosphatase NrnA [Bacteroidales bacterium]MCL2133661.1 bifunctional oligoribonuclease/PAP phosphatase NrnA [Bacteroidales bacterium]
MKLPIDIETVSILSRLLNESRKIVILMHVNPDGDAMGACLAIYHSVLQLYSEKEVVMVSPNHYPAFLQWLESSTKILIFKDKRKIVKEKIAEADLIICVDFNSLARLEDVETPLRHSSVPKILIDHHIHPNREEFAVAISDTTASSTSEIVYRLLQAMNLPVPVPAAEALLTGIMTDTNNFRDNASTPETFEVLADLLRLGVDKDKVTAAIYENFSASRMKLLGYALENMVTLPEYNAAYMSLSLEELNRFNFQPGDTESFVNYPLNIAKIKLSAYMSEQQDGSIRCSFRSRGDFSVNDLARKHFNGGGHRNAAGGRLTCSLKEATAFFVAQLENYKDVLQ